MNPKKFDKNAQMMTLEALIAALLIIASVLFVVSQAPSHIQQGSQYSEVQLKHYGEDVIDILERSPSPDVEYDSLLQYYISKNKYNELDEFLNDTLPGNVGYRVALAFGNDKEELFSNGHPRGDQIIVTEMVAVKSVSIGGIPGGTASVKKIVKSFPAGSLIIPMDDFQVDLDTSDNYVPLILTQGLIYNITAGIYSNGDPISVWQILLDPRNSTYPEFYTSSINTSDDPWNHTNISDRKYAGGPYVIDGNDLTLEIRNNILNASKMSPDTDLDDITIHEIMQTPIPHTCVELGAAPRLAAYPPQGVHGSELNETIAKYYKDSGVPYTILTDEMILNNSLDNFDILTIPHANLSDVNLNDSVIIKIMNWVSNGGTIHIECEGIRDIDSRIENVDDNVKHPWFGFIGVEETDATADMQLVGNGSGIDTTYGYGAYASPGAYFDVLAQSAKPDGTFPYRSGSTHSFRLIHNASGVNYSQVNPKTTILAGTANTFLPPDGEHIVYAAAPYDKGHVIYLAGHDQSTVDVGGCCHSNEQRTPQRERLMFESFFYPALGKVYDYGLVEVQLTMWYI